MHLSVREPRTTEVRHERRVDLGLAFPPVRVCLSSVRQITTGVVLRITTKYVIARIIQRLHRRSLPAGYYWT